MITMKRVTALWLSLCCIYPTEIHAQEPDTTTTIHHIEADVIPSTILHTNRYLQGGNAERRTMNYAFTARLKYAFASPEGSMQERIYRGAYQGIGMAIHDFNWQLGHPWSAFIFQGARIKTISPYINLNYEWNLGLTAGWHPYDIEKNPDNKVIGSRVTAYIDADLYLNFRLSRHFDLNAGISAIHFSNGNTTVPNAGLNVLGGRMSLAYYLNRPRQRTQKQDTIPHFHRHLYYDLVAYGAWYQLGYNTDDGPVIIPGKYGVFGFNFNPMYGINHWFSTGLSVDGVYDRGANIYKPLDKKDKSVVTLVPNKPKTLEQMAIGLSARAEFIMPYFSINVGVGHYLLGAQGDLNEWYQILALKVHCTHHLFLHIGYSLRDFKYPNHLMLGTGWRF